MKKIRLSSVTDSLTLLHFTPNYLMHMACSTLLYTRDIRFDGPSSAKYRQGARRSADRHPTPHYFLNSPQAIYTPSFVHLPHYYSHPLLLGCTGPIHHVQPPSTAPRRSAEPRTMHFTSTGYRLGVRREIIEWECVVESGRTDVYRARGRDGDVAREWRGYRRTK